MVDRVAVRALRAAVAVAALAGAAAADPREAVVTTSEGRQFRGTLDARVVHVATAAGDQSVELVNVVKLELAGDDGRVTLVGGANVAGRIEVAGWKLESRLGSIPVSPEKTRTILFNPPANENEVASLHVNSAMAGRLVASADGAIIYFLNASDATLVSIATADLTIASVINLPAGATAWALAPDGKTAVAGGGKTLTSIDVANNRVLKSFEIEHQVYDVLPLDGETVIVNSEGGLLVVSLARKVVVRREPGGRGPAFSVTPDRRKVYLDGASLLLPEKAPSRAEDFVPLVTPLQSSTVIPFMTFTPDGRLALDRTGNLRRPARSYVADMADCGKLEPSLSAVTLPLARRLVIFTKEGFAKWYDLDTLEVKGSARIGRRAWSVIADEKRRVLFAFCAAGDPSQRGEATDRITPAGDLVVLPIPE